MKHVFFSFVSFMIIVPLFAFFFIYTIGKSVLKLRAKRAFHVAVDGSTIFFMFGVHVLLQAIFHRSYAMELLIFFIVTMIICTVVYWKMKSDVPIGRIFKICWKINFLLFFVAYMSLLIYGIVHRVTIELS